MRVLFSDDIPDPHDIVIICLADACGIWERILSIDEQAEVAERIELVQKMDLIGQSLTRAIRELEQPDVPTPDEKKQIPRVSGLAFIANAMGIKGNLNTFLLKQYRALGPVFRVQALNRRFIVLAGTEANQFVARIMRFFARGKTGCRFMPMWELRARSTAWMVRTHSHAPRAGQGIFAQTH